jgi:Zn-dependent protease
MGTISILLIGVGYAKPVPVNTGRFRHRKRDYALTALAGLVSNLLMAVVFLLILRAIAFSSMPEDYKQLTMRLLTYAAYINVSLAVFNLLPIPPLDGSRVITALLPDHAYDNILRNER